MSNPELNSSDILTHTNASSLEASTLKIGQDVKQAPVSYDMAHSDIDKMWETAMAQSTKIYSGWQLTLRQSMLCFVSKQPPVSSIFVLA
jgi:hypothetical protein